MVSKLTRSSVEGACYLKSATLCSDAIDTLTICDYDDTLKVGDDETVLLALSCAANTSSVWVSGDDVGVYFAHGIYITLTDTGDSSASIEYAMV